jgi:hypothetical protein
MAGCEIQVGQKFKKRRRKTFDFKIWKLQIFVRTILRREQLLFEIWTFVRMAAAVTAISKSTS